MENDVTGHHISELLDNPYFQHVATLKAPETQLVAVAMRRLDKRSVARVFVYNQTSGIILFSATHVADWDRSKQGFSAKSFGYPIAMETNELYLKQFATNYELYRAIVGCNEQRVKEISPTLYGLCCLRRTAMKGTPAEYTTMLPVGENYWHQHTSIPTDEGKVKVYRKLCFQIPPVARLDRLKGPSRITYDCRFEIPSTWERKYDGVLFTLVRYYPDGKWPTLEDFVGEERNQPFYKAFLEEKKQFDLYGK